MRRLLLALTVVVLAACHGSSSPQSTGPKSTKVNPGPNSTAADPGPNNTANGPLTLQGTLIAGTTCIELDGNATHQPASRYELTFENETIKHQAANVILSGPDGDRTVGPHDTIYVAGHTESGSGPCGKKFTVEKVVSVIPD